MANSGHSKVYAQLSVLPPSALSSYQRVSSANVGSRIRRITCKPMQRGVK
jgi:hypothetical protein